MSVRGPLITATIVSLAVVSAWSYMASLAIGSGIDGRLEGDGLARPDRLIK